MKHYCYGTSVEEAKARFGLLPHWMDPRYIYIYIYMYMQSHTDSNSMLAVLRCAWFCFILHSVA
jgi:hypothetical protein